MAERMKQTITGGGELSHQQSGCDAPPRCAMLRCTLHSGVSRGAAVLGM